MQQACARCDLTLEQIRKDFIVDEDEDDEAEARRKRRREKRKRPREEREDEGLDDEDLELIGMKPQQEETQNKFKRLKRGPRQDEDGPRGGIDDIFADELDEQEERRPRGGDEFEDFIEDDVFSDDERQQREDVEVAAPRRGVPDLDLSKLEGLDEMQLEDIRAAFGDGHDYDFALEKEDEDEELQAQKDRNLNLKDVFEPSQLRDKLLTEEDNHIRFEDEPERFQIARKPYAGLELTEEEFREEAQWIAKLLWPKVSAQDQITPRLQEPFERSVLQSLEFLTTEQFEVPYIISNRKDYLIHVHPQRADGTRENPTQLLRPKDLWEIYELDLKFRALIEKRRALQKIYDELKSTNIGPDSVFEEMVPQAVTLEELQDLHDYLYFQYASQIKDLVLTNGETNGAAMSQKKANTKGIYESVRDAKAYGVARAYGITGDQFAQNITQEGVKTYAEDPNDKPQDLADSLIDAEFTTGEKVLKAGQRMFAEEIVTNPRFRKYVRGQIYVNGVFDCHRTEKGLRKIDEQHPYYEFKYLRSQTMRSFVNSPSTYLKMLRAEEEGLIVVKIRIPDASNIKRDLVRHMRTDNYSDVAGAWNKEREHVVAAAFDKTLKLLGRVVKETVKSECEHRVAQACQEEFGDRLDQAPYQPIGMRKGTTPRTLALSIGRGVPGKDPIHWVFVDENGRPAENGTLVELAPGDEEHALPEGKDVSALLSIVRERDVEVLAVAGFTPDTRKLISYLNAMIDAHKLQTPTGSDADDRKRFPDDRLEVVIVNDEIARLYHTSQKARKDHPGWAPLTHYCFALARYVQDPLKEYAALGSDIISLTFHHGQHLLPQEKLMAKLEMALVDKVNLVGVDINEAAADSAIANLLPYVCGLGPRKAQHLVKVVNINGGYVNSRENLLVNDKHQAMTIKVWNNAASTLFISYEPAEDEAEFLDSTRIHPEDYDIARKMAADALELDEEDIEAERQEFGSGAILRRLIREEAQDRVNDLVLEEYADQLERKLNAKKRSTLETIRAELIEPFEELRHTFNVHMHEDDIFTMFTGETNDSLQVGMNVPVSLKRVQDHYVEGLLDCGMVAVVEPDAWHDDPEISPRSLFSMHQTVQAHITSLNRKEFSCTVSLREEQTKRPFKRFDPEKLGLNFEEWDAREEAADKLELQKKNPETSMRATRVLKHANFRPFNSRQAEEYLGSQARGDVVIRPSSNGSDHLAVTWKVADGLFQHLDVLELDKENEFALGRTLRIGSKYNYSDLDELIVDHVRKMSRKVDEMMNSDKFQDKTKNQLGKSLPLSLIRKDRQLTYQLTEEWLNTYTAANPKRSMYQFCLNREKPGYFHLMFKAGQKAKITDWPVKVVREGYELRGQQYPDMRGLCNGFKLLFGNMASTQAALGGGLR